MEMVLLDVYCFFMLLSLKYLSEYTYIHFFSSFLIPPTSKMQARDINLVTMAGRSNASSIVGNNIGPRMSLCNKQDPTAIGFGDRRHD